MKIYKKIIDNCWNCPNKAYGWTSLKCKEKALKKIEDGEIIPNWCPLEDYKEADHEALA